tara:strand:- start:649 stop:870 length:222 start_codon:yes stop_codon:yes gene_type:complete
MTELQKQLLNEFVEQPKKENDTIIPQSLVSLSEASTEVARDESDLSYNELLEDYIKFKKPAIMKLHTFNRLWN